MIACAKALTAAGATTIDAVVTHALFPEAACQRHDFSPAFARSVRRTACRIPPMPSRSMNLFVDALQERTDARSLPETSR